MKKGVGKTVQARQLGRHLRELRKEAGVRVEQAAGEIGVSDATLYRFESGMSVPRPPDVKELCATYGVTGDLVDALVALAKEADAPGWWRSYSGTIPRWFDTFVSMESAATQIRAYESEVVFGLLQTRRYAEAVSQATTDVDPDEVAKGVEVRMTRQRILARRLAPDLDVVLGEAALLRSPDDRLMAEQLAHLDAMSRRPNVTVRIVPIAVLHRAVDCGARFTMLAFPTDRRGMGEPPVVFADNLTGAAYLSEQAEIDAYDSVWRALGDVALSPAESRQVINEYRERYERT